MTFPKGDIAIYLIVGLGLFTILTGFVFARLTKVQEDDPSEFTAHWRDDERR